MRIALAAIGGALVGAAIAAGGITWIPGIVFIALARSMGERDRRPQGRYIIPGRNEDVRAEHLPEHLPAILDEIGRER